MDEMKDKMKGFMKKVTPSSSSKFTGQGRVLGSSSSSSSSSSPASSVNSRLLNPPTKPNPNPNPKPRPPPQSPKPPSDPDSAAAESARLFLSFEPREEAVEIALRLLRNVAREPGSEKFRRIWTEIEQPSIVDYCGYTASSVILSLTGMSSSVVQFPSPVIVDVRVDLWFAHIGLATVKLLDILLVSRSSIQFGIPDNFLVLGGSAVGDAINQFKWHQQSL